MCGKEVYCKPNERVVRMSQDTTTRHLSTLDLNHTTSAPICMEDGKKILGTYIP